MHLSKSQAKRFSKLFYSLLSFVDAEYDPLAELVERGGPGNPFDADYFTPVIITELCSFIFNAQGEGRRDGVIDAFLAANPDGLSAEDLAQIAQWKDALSTPLFVVESSPESTVLMANGTLFSVTAVTRDACEVVGDAPAMIVATLLPFDGAIVVTGTMPSYHLDRRSGLQEKILLQGRKLRAGGHICTTAEELSREAPLLRVRSTKDHDESISLAVEDLIISALEKMQKEEPGKLLFDPEDEDEDAFFASIPATHAGALAGLSPEERAAAVTAHFEEFMAGTLKVMGEKVDSDYFHCAPVRTLAQVLDCRPLDELQGMARSLLHDPNPTGDKERLITDLREEFMLMSTMPALVFLAAGHDDIAMLAESAWRAGGMVEMSRAEHDALPVKERWLTYDPFLSIFVWDDKIAAVIPDEIVAAMSERDWEFVHREQACLKHARHLVEVCLDLYGLISLDDLTGLYLSYYPEDMGREDFEDFLEHIGPTSYAQYSMWIYGGETYVVNPLLVEQELIEEMVLDEAVFIDGDALDECDEPTEEELFRRHLLECREGIEAWEIPAKTTEELEAYDVFRSLEELPSHSELQEYLDAHVPEGEDEYLYAAGVISALVQMAQLDLDPDGIFEELQDMGLVARDVDTPLRILGLFLDFMNDVALWTNNGWSQSALLEHRLEASLG